MSGIKGTTVILHEKTMEGKDPLGKPIYSIKPVKVCDVLIGEPGSDGVNDTVDFNGKQIQYILAIPKGDCHDWTDSKVSFFGKDFLTVGAPTYGIDGNIPLRWNAKVKVVLYE